VSVVCSVRLLTNCCILEHFHPLRRDNQKKVFIAEENERQRLRLEAEKAAQVEKDRVENTLRSKDQGELSFMYNAPPGFKRMMEEEERRKMHGPVDHKAEEFLRKKYRY
jgi:hypothetical protein